MGPTEERQHRQSLAGSSGSAATTASRTGSAAIALFTPIGYALVGTVYTATLRHDLISAKKRSVLGPAIIIVNIDARGSWRSVIREWEERAVPMDNREAIAAELRYRATTR